MEFEIRFANEDDARAVAIVHVESWRAAYRGLMPDSILQALSVDEREAVFHQIVVAPKFPRMGLLVAEREGLIEGFAAFGPCRDLDAPRAGELYALYVHPRAWGTGVGRALLQCAVEELRERDFAELVLWVLDSNARARRFYERHGWRADGAEKLDDHFGSPLHEVRYRAAEPS